VHATLLDAHLAAAETMTPSVRSQVNADKYGDLGSRFDVKGFPTILYFPRGKPAVEHTTCAPCPSVAAHPARAGGSAHCCRCSTPYTSLDMFQPPGAAEWQPGARREQPTTGLGSVLRMRSAERFYPAWRGLTAFRRLRRMTGSTKI